MIVLLVICVSGIALYFLVKPPVKDQEMYFEKEPLVQLHAHHPNPLTPKGRDEQVREKPTLS